MGGAASCAAAPPNTAQDEAALRIAAHNGDVQTLNKMLKANVDINATNPGGSSALHLAARAGQDDVVKLLLAEERCATNVPDKTHGETPLHEAVFWGHVECCRKLLKAKADPNTENRSGQTPRDLAEDMRFKNVLQVLRDDGRSNPADEGGSTPVDEPKTEGDRLTVDELVALMKSWKEVGDDENKFCARQLELGEARDMDVRDFVGLDDNVIFGGVMEDPVKAMKLEWRAASRDPTVGSEADWENFVYVTEGRAQTDMVPAHVLQSFESGHYHGGSITKEEFDQGHEGMGLDDFLELESSKTAKLKKEHMIAIRLYTSSSYHLFNKPMRDRTKPHPIKVSVYILTQGLKKLRQVLAAKDPKEYAKKKQLWRGMKNMALDIRKFSEEGGAELAPMSTTEDPAVAEKYSESSHGLIFEYTTEGNSRGVEISEYSMYPKEKEFLYPPLTYLLFDKDNSEPILRRPDGSIKVSVKPQIN